jgi:CubicO group peptidase (beta-lactamase class C family)
VSFAQHGAIAQGAAFEEGFEAFSTAATNEIEAGRIPGAIVLIGRDGRIAYRGAFGAKSIRPEHEPLDPDTIFDLASLTKPIATATAIMQLAEAGRLDLHKPVAQYWPAFAANGKEGITARQLLTHTSGLPADLDLSSDWNGEGEALSRTIAIHPRNEPGERFLYSDINFIVLGELVRRISGEPLSEYVQEHIFRPLRMVDTGFNPAPSERIAPANFGRGELRWRRVQDPTAYRMGGAAGHAGLFSTADDLARFAQMLLNGGSLDGARILRPETVTLMTQGVMLPGGVRRALGWDASSSYSVGMDEAFGPSSFGHTGYTGCLLWIDPPTNRFLIVLTSRLHPDGQGDVKPLRLELAHIIGDRSH